MFKRTRYFLGCLTVWPVAVAAGLFLMICTARAGVSPEYILDMDIEDLMSVEVTSVSRYNQLLLDSPAAVTIIDRDQIRQSGFRDMPEILRLAPGVQVSRQSASLWYASSRSFPDRGHDKMLVLLDGRSIYSEDVGQVYWSNQSFFLEDIEQVEVVRGPGGTYWGYNAVNGVINIVSKKVKDTQGLFVDSGFRDDGSSFTQARYGGKLSPSVHYRILYDVKDQAAFRTAAGEDANDGYRLYNTGFRIDFEPEPTTCLTFEGTLSRGRDGDAWHPVPSTSTFSEGHVRSRLDHRIDTNLDLRAQIYYSELTHSIYEREQYGKGFALNHTILDSDFQLDWRAGGRHRIVAGGGLRTFRIKAESGYEILFEQSRSQNDRYNLFLTDEIALVPDRLFVTLGTKAEYNQYTGWGWQPSGRLLYKATPTQSAWASVSRALRMPHFEDGAKRLMAGPYPNSVYYFRGEPVKDEQILAFELGYRNQISPDLSVDLAAYYNELNQIRFWKYTLIPSTQPGVPDIIDSTNNYETDVRTQGGELAMTWQAAAPLTLRASYAYFHTDYTVPDPELWINPPEKAERHMAQLSANAALARNLNLNAWLAWNNAVTLGWSEIPEYWRLDLRLAMQVSDQVSVALVGQNLLDDEHLEIINGDHFAGHESVIPRSVYLSVTLNF